LEGNPSNEMNKSSRTINSTLHDVNSTGNQITKVGKKKAFETQLKLIEVQKVSSRELIEAARFLRPQDYQDVIIERSLGKWCGYPICGKKLEVTKLTNRNYRISLSQRKVFDVRELRHFCSSSCAMASCYFMRQLSEEPIFMRSKEQVKPVELLDVNEKDVPRER
jgi:hypothetical protein